MDLSVIIVNYNVRYFLEQALLSVQAAAKDLNAEVWVVDNASSDDSVAMVMSRFPSVHLVANRSNVGFSKANNLAIRQSSADFILLLNPDTVVEEDTFIKCLSFMKAHPEAGAVGVRMMDGSGTFLPESKRGFPTPWVAFCKAIGLASLFPTSPIFNRYYLGHLPVAETHEVDVLPGAFMFLRAKALADSGLLDEDFFMYGEDIDLSYRIQQAGWKNYYLADARIIHYKGESTKKGSLNYVRTFYQAMIIFARKHFQGPRSDFYILMLRIGIYARALVTLLSQWWKRIRIPAMDAILIYVGLYMLQQFWGQVRFENPAYYNWRFWGINAPIYTLLWVLGIFFSGGYDRPFYAGRLLRGLLMGTLVIAAVYGFLPGDFRSSRALILLGLAWSVVSTLGLRAFWHYLQHGSFHFHQKQERRLIIVGGKQESLRVRELLKKAHAQMEYIGTVSAKQESTDDFFLGNLSQLSELARIYRAQEFIFCSADVSTQQILTYMATMGSGYAYKILPEDSLSIIGSHSKNASGELYTVDISFQIDELLHRRNKWLFDKCVALCVWITFALLFWWFPVGSVQDAWMVFRGRRTWIGYAPVAQDVALPTLRPCIYTPAATRIGEAHLDATTLARLNVWYARNYTVSKDFAILWSAFSNKNKTT